MLNDRCQQAFEAALNQQLLKLANRLIFPIKQETELAGNKSCFYKYEKYKNHEVERSFSCVQVLIVI